VSQEIGHNKPSPDYFNACFAQIPDFEKSRCIMVGDSLSSDILGGINAGIATCWVAPPDKDPGHIRPDYRIEPIAQLEALLDDIKKEG
jgi:FMN phosphatase YigB (HAD superfamily)